MGKQILFRYCKLSRAAELLSVRESDLINLAVMGDIDCLIKLDWEFARYYLWHERHELVGSIGSFLSFGGDDYITTILRINSLSRLNYVSGVCKALDSNRDPYRYLLKGGAIRAGLELDVKASGLWILPPYIVDDIESGKEVELNGLELYLQNDFFYKEESFIQVISDSEKIIRDSDLYITSEDVIKIMSGNFDKKITNNDNLIRSGNLKEIDSIEKEARNLSKDKLIHQSQKKAIENRADIHRAINKLLALYPSKDESDDDRYRNRNDVIIKSRIAKLVLNHEATLFEGGVSPIKDHKLLISIISDYLDELGWKRR